MAQQAVQRAPHSLFVAVQDMGVNHSNAHVLVAQQLLHGAYVVAGLKEMDGERMPLLFTGIGINRPLARRKEILPAPFPTRVDVFPLQGISNYTSPKPARKSTL
jgi:hypothetical protein